VHEQLKGQIAEFLAKPPSQEMAAFLEAIDATYRARDAQKEQLERSLQAASRDLFEQTEQQNRDIQAIQHLELELRHAEKLRAVGQLAAGVAHEINTPMQFVGDNVHFLKGACGDLLQLGIHLMVLCDQLEAGEDPRLTAAGARKLAEEMDINYLLEELPKAFARTSEGVARVVEIVTAMKDLGRSDHRNKVLADLNRGLSSTLVVAQNEIKHVADIELEFAEIPLIPCHAGELNQVFLNLVVNAAHAVGTRFASGGRGVIRVRTRLEGDAAVIEVSDNGCGIPEDKQRHIFEPFFTTKPVGQGTGQGLAIARSIVVDKHGGSMWFESKAGEGTTFFVSIPLRANATQDSLTGLEPAPSTRYPSTLPREVSCRGSSS
jgi:signal transduction histidine kinase